MRPPVNPYAERWKLSKRAALNARREAFDAASAGDIGAASEWEHIARTYERNAAGWLDLATREA